jgi:hypothetical protein
LYALIIDGILCFLEDIMKPRKIRKNIIGKKFGRLTVIKRVKSRKTANAILHRYMCLCDCGNKTTVYRTSIAGGKTRSCGCYKEDVHRGMFTKHGKSKTKIYQIWRAMKQRCQNKNDRAYPRYGGRGISVCERWENFENFLHDMGEKPQQLSLDRIDNNGNYEPSNCKWSTQVEQNNNRRPHSKHIKKRKSPIPTRI